MWKHASRQAAVVLCSLLLLAGVQHGGSTCRGHDCDEQHTRAKGAGLLGATRGGVQRPKECRGAKTYPVEGKLKPQEMATPAVNIRWAGKDADIDKVQLRNYVRGLLSECMVHFLRWLAIRNIFICRAVCVRFDAERRWACGGPPLSQRLLWQGRHLG
jgi:hypothetical protein